MKAELFKDMMSGFKEAAKYRRGQEARVRVSRFSTARVVLKPKEIRRVRTTPHLRKALTFGLVVISTSF